MKNRTKDLGRDWDDRDAQAARDSSHERPLSDAPLRAEDEAPLVLIVEDEGTIAEALRLVVEEIGCRVALAPNGVAALAIARHEKPALVLTDLMMPVMDGWAFITRLQQEAACGAMAAPPVVVMTAARRVHARDLAVEDVLHKPFELDEVEAKVEQFVGERLRRSA